MRTWLYFVLCVGGYIYIGVAADPIARFELHRRGLGAFALKLRRPIELLGAVDYPTRSLALRAEWRAKRLRRERKVELAILASGDEVWRNFASPRGWKAPAVPSLLPVLRAQGMDQVGAKESKHESPGTK
jgi:putative endonuclease